MLGPYSHAQNASNMYQNSVYIMANVGGGVGQAYEARQRHQHVTPHTHTELENNAARREGPPPYIRRTQPDIGCCLWLCCVQARSALSVVVVAGARSGIRWGERAEAMRVAAYSAFERISVRLIGED